MNTSGKDARREWHGPVLISVLAHIALIVGLILSVSGMPAAPPVPEIIAIDIVEPEPAALDAPEPAPPPSAPAPAPAAEPAPYVAPVTVDRDVPDASMPALPPLPSVDDSQVLPAPPRLQPASAPRLALMPVENSNPVSANRSSEAAPIGLAKPSYPRAARKLGQQGAVTVRATITRDGRASGCAIIESSGYPRLDQAAREAVLAARYRPARIGGIPHEADLSLRFRFRLEE